MAEIGRFAIAIPNYNYGSYLGATLASAVNQQPFVGEIHVSDNCSTDDSLDVARSFIAHGVEVSVNRTNLGFSGNLDRAVQATSRPFVVLLSSDDLIKTGSLAHYEKLLTILGDRAPRSVVTSSVELIDATGVPIGHHGPPSQIWGNVPDDRELSALMGFRVLSAPGCEILRRSLQWMRCPVPFCSTAYPRVLYDEVEGYGGGRLINPDKWFHWKLCYVADRVYFIDHPLFSYRIHSGNQGSQQRSTSTLKHLVDEYTSSFQVDDQMLTVAGLTRADMVRAFLRRDVVERGFAAILDGDTAHARRIYHFGRACYPRESSRDATIWALFVASLLGSTGVRCARVAARARERYART